MSEAIFAESSIQIDARNQIPKIAAMLCSIFILSKVCYSFSLYSR